jgi:hypothetical protein
MLVSQKPKPESVSNGSSKKNFAHYFTKKVGFVNKLFAFSTAHENDLTFILSEAYSFSSFTITNSFLIQF